MKQVVAAIFVRDDNILLGRRASHKTYPGCWDLPGGHVEQGETVEQALIRECREEVGVSPCDYTVIGAIREPAGSALCHIFAVHGWEGGEPIMLGDEHTELAWFSVADACAIDRLALPDYPAFFRAAIRR